MHNFISMQSFFISATLFILCLYYCLVSVTLVRVTDQIVYIYYKASLNIRTILIIFCKYFYGNNIFNASLPTDNYCKVAALKAYNSVYKYDFLCVSETFLNSSFESNDKDLMIEDYNLTLS